MLVIYYSFKNDNSIYLKLINSLKRKLKNDIFLSILLDIFQTIIATVRKFSISIDLDTSHVSAIFGAHSSSR